MDFVRYNWFCSMDRKQSTVSRTVSVQNEIEKDKKDSSSSIESKDYKDYSKVTSEKKTKEKSVAQPVGPPAVKPVINKESDGKEIVLSKKVSKKGSKESRTIKKISLEKIVEREGDVKCDKEVSQKPDDSERILHFSKKKVTKTPEKVEEKVELLEPTPLSWKEET
ncbi:Protein CBG12048 [Caenorhabditis briggsae]|uniref:Protein CBG12048 n=1 Tax=Caenorhabditis briggsae TaxID=6238 RepID=A8XEF4_CAEBR|nr:Protein CBG12048 [Caenorhabditis briggsae]CAP31089.2 Protein CBG12048 [Caenorhabditis briggsae]